MGVALCEIEKEKSIYKRHLIQIMMEDEQLSTLIFSNNSIVSCLLFDENEKINEYLTGNDLISHEMYKATNGIIQHFYGLNVSDERQTTSENTLGALIKKRNNSMNMLDQNQFNTVYKDVVTHSRIRGLAGSGKTILLVKKMAYLHYRFPELELAYVFYTKSLKQYINKLFVDYFYSFEKAKEPNMKKIHILHGWGGNEMDGFYTTVCRDNGITYKTWGDARNNGGFAYVCSDAIKVLGDSIQRKYDYIFVDEAQDFCLPFFKLALKTLKYLGKLVYAYDELQSLNEDNSMPTKQQIFDEEKCEDINLSVCYRTPMEILVTAHALGLGIYNTLPNGTIKMVNMMEDFSIWDAVGYKIKNGELGYGKYVELYRNEEIEYRRDA